MEITTKDFSFSFQLNTTGYPCTMVIRQNEKDLTAIDFTSERLNQPFSYVDSQKLKHAFDKRGEILVFKDGVVEIPDVVES